MQPVLKYIVHLSLYKIYALIRYGWLYDLKTRAALMIHNLGYSKYPQAIPLTWASDPLIDPKVQVGSIVRYPTGAFFKVTELVPGAHIRFVHMEDVEKEKTA